MTMLKEVLEQKQFSDFNILTSKKWLDVEVKSVEISETPDISQYVPKSVFLLTTAMVYKDKPENLIPLIQSLKEAQVAGLGIKLGRFLTEIPQSVIDYAEKIEFALISTPAIHPLGFVLHQMMQVINDRKEELLLSAISIQKQFSQLLINDVNASRFMSVLNSIIHVPTILLSPFFEAEAFSDSMMTKLSHVSKFEKKANELYKRDTQKNEYFFTVQTDENEQIDVSMFPIRLSSELPYFLLVLTPSKMPYPLSTVAIEQAIITLSIILFKNQKMSEHILDRKSGHFRHFLREQRDRNISGKMLLQLGERFDARLSQNYQVIYCRVIESEKKTLLEQTMQVHMLSSWMQKKLMVTMPHIKIFHDLSHKYLMLFIQDDVKDIEQLLNQLAQLLDDKLGIKLSFSLGKAYDKLDQVHDSATEAKLTYEKTLTLKECPVISKYYDYYDTNHFFNLFDQLNREKVTYFCKSILKELAFPTESYYMELRHTLKVYLDHQCEITKTAKMLFLHRNTVKYRIERCEELLGEEIYNPKTNLNYRMALELSEYMDKN